MKCSAGIASTTSRQTMVSSSTSSQGAFELSGTEIRKQPLIERKELLADFLKKVKDGHPGSMITSRVSPDTSFSITRAS
jgi:hypothetical protein